VLGGRCAVRGGGAGRGAAAALGASRGQLGAAGGSSLSCWTWLWPGAGSLAGYSSPRRLRRAPTPAHRMHEVPRPAGPHPSSTSSSLPLPAAPSPPPSCPHTNTPPPLQPHLGDVHAHPHVARLCQRLAAQPRAAAHVQQQAGCAVLGQRQQLQRALRQPLLDVHLQRRRRRALSGRALGPGAGACGGAGVWPRRAPCGCCWCTSSPRPRCRRSLAGPCALGAPTCPWWRCGLLLAADAGSSGRPGCVQAVSSGC
jgi:hypothetical protein